MNLSDLPDDIFSHPEYSLKKHIKNMQKCFDDNDHKIACKYHDFGKINIEFQNYIRDSEDNFNRTTHSRESAFFYLLTEKFQIKKETLSIFYSILKHHSDLDNLTALCSGNFIDENSVNILFERVNKIVSRIGINSYNDDDPYSFIDFIFSIEKDLDQLKNIETFYFIREVFSKLIFSDKYEAIYKTPFIKNDSFFINKYIQRLEIYLKDLTNEGENEINKLRNKARKEMLTNFTKNTDKKIFILEAPTGIGKTFSALNLALEICRKKNKTKIINALPMTSIIDQTYEEYGKIIPEEQLLKFHYLTSMKNYDNEIVRDQKKDLRQCHEFLSNSWSIDNFIITTFNQIFNIFFSSKQKDLIKFWNIENSVIILDEIQSIPRILLKDISYIINYFSDRYNVDFIMMSATIPEIRRFLPENSFADLLSDSYMKINNRYKLIFNSEINSKDVLCENILQKILENSSVLCVVNTKSLALDVYEKLIENEAGEFKIYLLSTNHIPKHRKKIINELKSKLNNKNSEKVILISTQVIEAGVDLDFDIGFREFSPLSSVIQTAGRINRENSGSQTELIITDKIGNSPYDKKDVLYGEISKLLAEKNWEEKELLDLLRKYFQLAIEQTSPDFQLLNDTEKLNFRDVNDKFQNLFMKEDKNNITVFIEIRDGLHRIFSEKIKALVESIKISKSLEEKLEYKSRLKEIYKKLSKYTVNVKKEHCNELNPLFEGSEIKVCSFDFIQNNYRYSYEKGWHIPEMNRKKDIKTRIF